MPARGVVPRGTAARGGGLTGCGQRSGRSLRDRTGPIQLILDGRLSRLGPAIVRELDHARRRRQDRPWELAASQLAAVVQSSRDAIISMTLDGIISSWNAAAERLYGWTDSEALGHPIAILAPPGRADEVAEMLVRVPPSSRICLNPWPLSARPMLGVGPSQGQAPRPPPSGAPVSVC